MSTRFSGRKELHDLEESFGSFLDHTYDLVKSYIEGRDIADVGSGTGVYAEKLADDGFNVVCFEIDGDLVEISRQRGLTVIQQDVLSDSFRDANKERFSSVLTLDVLEHLEDENRFLQSIRILLGRGGVFVVKVPAHSFLYSWHDKRIGHFRRYSKKQLHRVLTQNGFVVEEIKYYNILGFFGWLVICKLLSKSATAVRGKFADLLLSWTLRFERRFFSPFGLNLIAKARKGPMQEVSPNRDPNFTNK